MLFPLVISLLLNYCQLACSRSPVILVPGYGGNQVWARLNKSSSAHIFCERHTKDFEILWLSLENLFYPAFLCLSENFQLHFDAVTGATFNTPGVETEIRDFGNTSTIEYLSQWRAYKTMYFANMVKALTEELGYQRGVDLFGAPVDFRKSPDEIPEYFQALIGLVEKAYTLNGNRRVTLVGHSLGCLLVYHLLNRVVTAEWKQKHVHTFVSIAGPYRGSAMSGIAMASGDSVSIPSIRPIWARQMQRSFPTTVLLLPSASGWDLNETLYATKTANYTVGDYKQFFHDMGYPEGYDLLKVVNRSRDHSRPVDVVTHCLSSVGVATPEAADWRDVHFPDDQPDIRQGRGDGTVNERSSSQCSDWKAQQSPDRPVFARVFEGMEHLDMLRQSEVVSYVVEVLKASL